jgi:hypothetical protein
MIVVVFPLLVALVGAVLYFTASTEKPRGAKYQEVGRIMFFAGLLVVLWHLGRETVKL